MLFVDRMTTQTTGHSRMDRCSRWLPHFPKILLYIYMLLVLSLVGSDLDFASAQPVTSPTFGPHNFAFPNSSFTNEKIVFQNSSTLTTNSSGALCLTPNLPYPSLVVGRTLYTDPFNFPNTTNFSTSNSFSTMFSFNTLKYPTFTPGEGFTFFISPDRPSESAGDPGGLLGWINATTNRSASGSNFAVEFDIFQDDGYDPDNNHVGINVNSVKSRNTSSAPLGIDLAMSDSRRLLYAWIDYDGETIEVSLNDNHPNKPCKPVLSVALDLRDILVGQMYVGFSSSSGNGTNAQTTIFDWSFNTVGKAQNIYEQDAKCHRKGEISWWVIFGVAFNIIAVAVFVCITLLINRLRTRKISDLEDAIKELEQLDYGPRELSFRELLLATNKFSDDLIIGEGGFGKVYKGHLPQRRLEKCEEAVVAVKRISKTSHQGVKEFVSEVKVIGMLKHINMVPLLGWCHQKGEMLLVYEYMPNGNLEQLLFEFCKNHEHPAKGTKGEVSFAWEMRMRVLRGVAAALAFLHEECEQQVVHRDVKSSNVLLDKHFNPRLGDFGLARLHDRGDGHYSTAAAGTIGYMAPESFVTGNATSKSDVYSFGAMTLEVASGRKPGDWKLPGGEGLVKWVNKLHYGGTILDAVDEKLGTNYDTEEMERVLKIGLFCCLPDPEDRPTMRQVQAALEGHSPIFSSQLPPAPVAGLNLRFLDKYSDISTTGSVTDNWWSSQVNSATSFLPNSPSAARKALPRTSLFNLLYMRTRSWS